MESKTEDLPIYDGKSLTITAVSPVNIALVKYWGKADEENVIPINSSLSMTLSTDDLCSTTTVILSADVKENVIVLNGEREEFSKRMHRMLSLVKDSISEEGAKVFDTTINEVVFIPKSELLNMNLSVDSTNNFPTASGVASSSSGLSCLALCLCKLYGSTFDMDDISIIARLGSGSACRSIFGGFVIWDKGFEYNVENHGVQEADKKSKAIQHAPETHWDDL
jgi:diphosphomevalonate decarboxylase